MDDKVVTVGTKVALQDMVHVETDSGVTMPDMTVITAQINTDGTFSENGWDAVQGNVNIDFPDWVDDLMEQYVPGLSDGMTVAEFSEKVAGKMPELMAKLNEAGLTAEITDILTQMVTEVTDVLAKIPENVTLTFNDIENLAEQNVGAYLVGAVVTDSDHWPSADLGLLVITPDVDLVYLKWNHEDANNIWTPELLKAAGVDLYAKAFNDKEFTVENAEATEEITYKFITIDENGDLVFAESAADVGYGAYIEMAYIELEVDGEMFISDMIARPLIIVPNTAKVIFVDGSGAENADRKFVFDNQNHAMDVAVDGVVMDPAENENLTVTYVGVQTNTQPYNSTEAPKHAGAYVVTALYMERNENGVAEKIGVAVGAMVIEPTTSTITVEDATGIEDGTVRFRKLYARCF